MEEYVKELFEDLRTENSPKSFLQSPEIMTSEVEHGLKMVSEGRAVGVDNVFTEALVALREFGI